MPAAKRPKKASSTKKRTSARSSARGRVAATSANARPSLRAQTAARTARSGRTQQPPLTDRLIDLLAARGEAVTVADATRAVRGDTKIVTTTLGHLARTGRIRRVGRGLYAAKRKR
jgi:hypothetical protein